MSELIASAIASENVTSHAVLLAQYEPEDPIRVLHPTVCTNTTGYGPLLDEKTCDKMRQTLPRCQDLVQKCYGQSCPVFPQVHLALTQLVSMSAQTIRPTRRSVRCVPILREQSDWRVLPLGTHPYDMTRMGSYGEEKWIERWLNS